MKKRILSFLLALVMVLSMLPLSMLSALKVTAAEAAETTVTLTVEPSNGSVHAVYDEETQKYTFAADLSISSNEAFPLGSLQFDLTPADGMTVAFAADTTVLTTLTVTDHAETVGVKVVSYLIAAGTAQADAYQLGTTPVKLGTLTLTSTTPFTFSGDVISQIASRQMVNEVAPEVDDGVSYTAVPAVVSAYTKGDHGNAEATWTAVSDAAGVAAMANGGHFYLTGDVTMSAFVTLTEDTVLCLNGKTLTGASGSSSKPSTFLVQGGAKLTICDCTAHEENGEYVAGSIKPKVASGGMRIDAGRTSADQKTEVTIYDGIFDGGNLINGNYAGAIRTMVITTCADGVDPYAKVDIQGGEFCNFKTRQAGVIQLNDDTKTILNVANAKFHDNLACMYKGGVMYIGKGNTVTIDNCEFTNNSAVITENSSSQTTDTNGGVFNLNGGSGKVSTLTVSNSTFDGNTAGALGGVLWAGTYTQSTFTDCEFTDNTAGRSAGALFVSGASNSLTLDGCTLERNSATENTAAKGAYGGAVYFDSGSLSITDCTFTDNHISNQGTTTVDGNTTNYAGHGGALYLEKASSATISNTTFTENTAKDGKGTDKGGAIYCTGCSQVVSLNNVDFTGNEAEHGGAIYSTNSKLNITNGSDFIGNSASNYDGAIFCTGSTLDVNGSTFTGNTCSGDGPSVLHVESTSTARLENCTITGNSKVRADGATKDPAVSGAIRLTGGTSTLTFAGKMVVDNNTEADGTECNLWFEKAYESEKHALHVDGLTADSNLSIFTAAETRDDANKLLIATANQENWSTTWVHYDNQPESIIRMKNDKTFELVSHAHDDDEDGAVWIKWGDDADELTSLPTQSGNYLLVADINPTQEVKTVGGENIKICLDGHKITAPADGRMYWMRLNAQIKFCDCDWDDDDVTGTLVPGTGKQLTSGGNGGGIAYLQVSGSETAQITEIKLTVENVTIDGTGIESAYQGAAIWMGYAKCTTVLKNCTIKNCTSTNADSGAIYASSGSDLIAENARFENNRGTGASSKAGAIRINSQTPVVNLTDCVFYGNSATAGSGAFYVTTGNVTMTGGSLENNTGATTGGAINIRGGSVTLDGVTVKNNSLNKANAHLYGGAIYANAGTLTVQNGCKFENNSATASGTVDTGEVDADENPIYEDAYSHGGAIYACGSVKLTVSNSSFTGNQATNGGALDAIDATNAISLSGNTFTTNTAGSKGGAIYSDGSVFTLNADNTFTGNTAVSGGAVYIYNGSLTATDSTFDTNIATGDGGAIYMAGASAVTTTGCAFTENEAQIAFASTNSKYRGGGAIFATSTGKLTINTTTFTGNHSNTSGGAIYANKAGAIAINSGCSFTGNTADQWGGAIHRMSGAMTLTGVTMTGNTNAGDRGGSAIYMESSATVTLDDCTLTGNRNTGSSNLGAIQIQEKSTTLIVAGQTVIDDNFTKAGVERNIYYQQSTYDASAGNKNILNVKGLEDGARMSLYTGTERASADLLVKLADGATQETWKTSWIRYDRNGKQIDYVDGVFVFVDNSTHSHTDDEAGTEWTAWTSDTTLPTDGKHYYLTKDVVVSATFYHANSVNTVLCLNGHNIRSSDAAKKPYEISKGTLTVCDCTAYTDSKGHYHAGTIITSTNTNGGAVAVFSKEEGAAFILESGIIDGLGRTHTGTSAAVRISQSNPAAPGTFYLKGGEIRNCVNATAANSIIGLPTNGNLIMSGGKIHSNTSVNGGAIYLSNTNGGITITGGEISNNTATGAGGAIYSATVGAHITINETSGQVVFDGNTADTTGSAIHTYKANMSITGATFSNNTGTDATVFVQGGTAVLDGVTFTGNETTNDGAAVYINESGTATLKDCVVQNNVSRDGAVHLRNKNSTLNIQGKTVITDNTLADGTTPCNVFLNYYSASSSWGDLNLSAMDPDAKIYVTVDTEYNDTEIFGENAGVKVQVVEITDSTYVKDMVVLENEGATLTKNVTGDNNAKYAMYVKAEVDNEPYESVVAAQAVATTADKVIVLRADADAITLANDTTLDLNGYDVASISGAYTLYLMDSQTNDYSVLDAEDNLTGYGKVTSITGATVSDWHKVGSKYYLVLDLEDGISAHRVYSSVTAKALRPNSTGIGFQARFATNEVAREKITGFGMDLVVKDGETVKGTVPLDVMALSDRKLDSTGTPLVFAIKDIIKNTDAVIEADSANEATLIAENNTYANYTIAGTPFIKLSESESYNGTSSTVTFMDMVKAADENFANYNETQQTAFQTMCGKFSRTMGDWELSVLAQ